MERDNDVSSLDGDISLLFDDARTKLDQIELQSKQLKKQVIKDLAIALEGRISTDSICIEIVNELRGQVSERFIRECLDLKYKQKIRVDNAKKQSKINDVIKEEDIDNKNKGVDELAVLLPLNRQYEELSEENDDTKEEVETNKVVIINAATTYGNTISKETVKGRDLVNESEDGDNDVKKAILPKHLGVKDKTIAYFSHSKEQQLQLQQQSDEQDNNKDQEECPSCKELYYENCHLKEIIQKSDKLIISAEKLYTKNSSGDSDEKDDSIDAGNVPIGFEFSKTFREIREHIIPLFKVVGDNGLIWFNGKVDRKTEKTVYSGFGRLNNIQSEKSN